MITVDTPVRTWTPRVAAQLTVLAAAAFTYATAELVRVGALPAIADDLGVSVALVATLLAGYALVAAVMTVPLVRWTAHWPRRRALLVTLVALTVSQAISALAPNFAVLAGGRVLCALAHGLMWSVLAPIGARLVPASHAGRATTAVYVGTGLALVVGNPLTAALSDGWGWRTAVTVLALCAAAVTVAARAVLPPLTAPAPTRARRRPAHRGLVTLSALTVVGVTGHFVSYTVIVVIIRDAVGVRGPQLAWLLTAFGVAGLLAMALLARPLDRAPRTALLGCLSVVTAAFAVLTVLAAQPGIGWPAMLAGGAAVVGWGAAAIAMPPMLQTAAIRSAPDDPDGASGVWVAAFQVGIMAGSLAGGLLYEDLGLTAVTASSTVLMAVAVVGVATARGLFGVPPATSTK